MSREKTPSVTGGTSRDLYGAIVTIANEDRTIWRSFQHSGPPSQAVAEIIAKIDRLEGRWYIESISTPDTVYRDVINRGPSHPSAFYGERQFLGRLNRLDLLRVPLNQERSDSGKRVGHGWRGRKFVIGRIAA